MALKGMDSIELEENIYPIDAARCVSPAANVMSCGIAVSPVRIVHPKGLSSRKSKS